MSDLPSRLRAGEVLVADGAIGTLLIDKGLRPGDCPEAFNLSSPELLEQVARLYLEAGAEIVQTNTFGGSSLRLSRYGLEGRVEDVNRTAVEAVRRAVGDRAYVSGSCGPTGRLLEPYGDTEPGEMLASFREQIAVLVDAGVDILCIETMTDLTEAKLAIEAARSVSSTIPIIATMTFDPTPKGFRTIMGIDIERAAVELAKAGADVVGSNCGNGIEKMVEIAREFRRHADSPLAIQSNAGLPHLMGESLVYPETPEFVAEKTGDLLAVGVSVIGGCCGTTPEHIRAIRSVVDASLGRASGGGIPPSRR